MYELDVRVTKVMGTCTADPPMQAGDFFTVRDGDIRIPEGGYVCMWALQSLLPLLPAKERRIDEAEQERLELERRIADAFQRHDRREGRRASRQLEHLRTRLDELYEQWFTQET